MKFVQVLKSVALASALVAGSSYAVTQTFVNDGSFYTLANGKTYFANSQLISGSLNLSNDATALDNTQPYFSAGSSVISAFGIANIALSGANGGQAITGTVNYTDRSNCTANATPVPCDSTNYDPTVLTADTVSVTAPIKSLTADVTNLSNAQALSVFVTGGLTQTAAASQVATGGNITIQNLNVDLVNKVIFADVSGSNGLVSSNIQVFTFAGVTGPTSLDINSLAPGQSVTVKDRIDHLKLTTAAQNAIIKGLGLKSGLGQNTLKGLTDIGYLDSQITITAQPVPEPSTYALMALGLAGAGFVARRRSR